MLECTEQRARRRRRLGQPSACPAAAIEAPSPPSPDPTNAYETARYSRTSAEHTRRSAPPQTALLATAAVTGSAWVRGQRTEHRRAYAPRARRPPSRRKKNTKRNKALTLPHGQGPQHREGQGGERKIAVGSDFFLSPVLCGLMSAADKSFGPRLKPRISLPGPPNKFSCICLLLGRHLPRERKISNASSHSG